MNDTVRKTLILSSPLLLVCGSLWLGARAESAPPAAAQAPPAGALKNASEQYKNVQVLKEVPADQLIPAMQFITASLGVDCDYCHVEHAFEKDDKKPKVTARKMMEMMLTINNENFDNHREVTCYTCHKGSPNPVSVPVVSTEERPLEMMAGETVSATGNPVAESLLDNYLAAVGGANALKKITSRVAKGSVTAFGDQHLAVDIYAKAPDKRVSVMHMKNGESVTAYNGTVGWLSLPGRVHIMNAQELFGAKMDADFAFPADVKALYPKWETKPGEKIDGHDTWLVVGLKEGEPPLHLYLDQKSGVLLRLIRYVDSPLGYNPTRIDYADYRSVDGVKVPFRWTVARPRNHFTIQVEQLQQNVPVDDAKFVPPPPPPPAPGPPAR